MALWFSPDLGVEGVDSLLERIPCCWRSSWWWFFLGMCAQGSVKAPQRAVIPTIILSSQALPTPSTTTWKLDVCCAIFWYVNFYLKVPRNSNVDHCFKSIEFVTILLLFYALCFSFFFFFFGHGAYEILAPWLGIESTPPTVEGEVLLTGPRGKSLEILK